MMRIDGETKLMGLLGEGISYTMSPALHNRAAARLGINAVYVPLSMPASQLPSFLANAWHLGALGFNVTQPHKLLVASLVAGHGLPSINTLYRGPTGWQAASTDGEGWARGLERTGHKLASFQNFVVLGGGGAVQSILRVLPAGAPVTMLQRSDGTLTPAALGQALSGRGDETLLIQATSAPHHGDTLEAFAPALKSFRGVVSDIVYGKPSALYFTAIAQDLVAQDGESMLIEQARLSQKLWWGKAASYDEMAAALRNKGTEESPSQSMAPTTAVEKSRL